jgi:hypothetical protein
VEPSTTTPPQQQRSSRKTDGVIKQVLERLVVSNDSLTPGQRTPHVELLQQANFLVNIYVGAGTLSSFQVFRGYQPSLLDMPPTVVTQDMLAAYQQLVAVRALSRLLRSKRFDPYSKSVTCQSRSICACSKRTWFGQRRGRVVAPSRHRAASIARAHTPAASETRAPAHGFVRGLAAYPRGSNRTVRVRSRAERRVHAVGTECPRG